jgi:hypothetical protein
MPWQTPVPFEGSWIPEPNSGCWLWTSFTTRAGYGKLRIDHREVYAHRHSYEKFVGQIPDGMHVMHRCDTPCCVNPDHLFTGTNADNIADRVAKNRSHRLRGELQPLAKLTAADVVAIRNDPRTPKQVATAFGVAACTITNIRNRKRWRHIP